jgi:hypothetical protein
MDKIKPSAEQESIINAVTKGKNVSVDAVAGSGKTTTVLFIAQENPKKNIIQITYNKQLKFEVRQKAELLKITNLEIHTYHSLAVKFYDKMAHTDDKIINILTSNMPIKTTKNYNIIIIDEIQDMTPNYYFLVNKFIHDSGLAESNIIILGDRFQGIYSFKNADVRFLTLSNKIWNSNFINLPMQESYRVTENIAKFVNRVMLGYDRIVSNKKSANTIQYYKKNIFMMHTVFAKKILEYLSKGYKPSDIFVLAPSIKSTNNPVKKLENELVKLNIPVYFSRNEEEGLDEDIIKGKVVFTTFHQAKGRERKIVFVYSFDDSYFKFHGKEKDPLICPSELYVATTRASEILILLDGHNSNILPFLKCSYEELQNNPKIITFYGDIPVKKKERDIVKSVEAQHSTSVKDFTKFISEENNSKIIKLLKKIVKIKKHPNSKYTSEIVSIIKSVDGKKEDVSDINGIVIPAMYEYKKLKKCSLENIIKIMCENSDSSTMKFVNTNYEKLAKDFDKHPIPSFLYMGNLYIALTENIHSKLNQIKTYDWLKDEQVKICHKNLNKNFGDNVVYEKELGTKIDGKGMSYYEYKTNTYGTISFYGRIDAFDDDVVWEIKCVNAIQTEHILQLLVYAWIWNKCMKERFGEKLFKILNIRTGELQNLKYKDHIIDEIISIMLENKYGTKIIDEDTVFIKKCSDVVENIKLNKTVDLEMLDDISFHSDDEGTEKIGFIF